MSKYITLTEALRAECRAKLEAAMSAMKAGDGRVSFTHTLNAPDTKAKLWFTPDAYAKMWTLVSAFYDEVAWHGIASRLETEGSYEYLISDILVYPQEVTGSTVNTDQVAYQNWLDELDDDTFNSLRMQGHSHVNMGTSPSSVDLEHQGKILSQMDGDMFYIFLIWNKKNEHTVKIYDMRANLLFENSDVTVGVQGIGDMTAFLAESREKVKRKTWASTGGYDRGYYGGSGGYYGGGYGKPGGSTYGAGYVPKTGDKPITKPVSAAELAASKASKSAAPAKTAAPAKGTMAVSFVPRPTLQSKPDDAGRNDCAGQLSLSDVKTQSQK